MRRSWPRLGPSHPRRCAKRESLSALKRARRSSARSLLRSSAHFKNGDCHHLKFLAEHRIHVAAGLHARRVEVLGETLARVALRDVRGIEDVLHELLAAVGVRDVIDARHDGIGLGALDLLVRKRMRDDRHVGGNAALDRALGARGGACRRGGGRHDKRRRRGDAKHGCSYLVLAPLVLASPPPLPGARLRPGRRSSAPLAPTVPVPVAPLAPSCSALYSSRESLPSLFLSSSVKRVLSSTASFASSRDT